MSAQDNLGRQFVPETTAVKRNRAHNVDSDRLHRRREHLTTQLSGPNTQQYESRNDFIMRAAELAKIEDVLQDRGQLSQRRTLPREQR